VYSEDVIAAVPSDAVLAVKREEIEEARVEREAARLRSRADPLQLPLPLLEEGDSPLSEEDSPLREDSPAIFFPGDGALEEFPEPASPVSLAQHEEDEPVVEPPKRQPGAIMLGLIALFLLTWATLN
jgi:hypothetical protein